MSTEEVTEQAAAEVAGAPVAPEDATPRRKRPWLLVTVVVVGLVLAGGAFAAARLLASGSIGVKPGMTVTSQSKDGMSSVGTFEVDVTPAKELPTTEPDAMGIIEKSTEDGILVSTGAMTLGSGEALVTDGPKVEVVVTAETKLYRDDTFKNIDFKDLQSGKKIQSRVVAVNSLPDFDMQVPVKAWGRQVGDRVIAETLVFSPPKTERVP